MHDQNFPGNHRAKTNELLNALSAEIDRLYDSQDSDLDPDFYNRHPIHLVHIALLLVTERITGCRELVQPCSEVISGVLLHSQASSPAPSE